MFFCFLGLVRNYTHLLESFRPLLSNEIHFYVFVLFSAQTFRISTVILFYPVHLLFFIGLSASFVSELVASGISFKFMLCYL